MLDGCFFPTTKRQQKKQQQNLKINIQFQQHTFLKKSETQQKLIVFSDDVEELVTKEQRTLKNYTDGEKERETRDCRRRDRVAPEAEPPK